MGAYCLDPFGDSWWDPLTVWHMGASSFVFVDGHSDRRLWSMETTEDFMGPFWEKFGLIPVTDEGVQDLQWM